MTGVQTCALPILTLCLACLPELRKIPQTPNYKHNACQFPASWREKGSKLALGVSDPEEIRPFRPAGTYLAPGSSPARADSRRIPSSKNPYIIHIVTPDAGFNPGQTLGRFALPNDPRVSSRRSRTKGLWQQRSRADTQI